MGVFQKQDAWWIDYYVDGRRKREKIGPDKKLAETVLAKRKVEIAENRYLDKRKIPKTTFGEMATDYLEWSKANKRSWDRDETSLRALKKGFGGKRLADITTEAVERYKTQRVKHRAPATVNRELACLKHLFTKAIEWDKATVNPARQVKLFRERNTRLRYLDVDEEKALLDECAVYLRPIVVLALYTGMRLGEILNLGWSQVDLDNNLVLLENTKSGKRREIPLNATAKSALKRVPRHIRSPHVFCNGSGKPRRSIRTAFSNACARAKVEDVVFHTLRHTFASRLVMAGVDLVTVKELLGHSTLAMVLRYAHLSPEHRRNAVARLDGSIWSREAGKTKRGDGN